MPFKTYTILLLLFTLLLFCACATTNYYTAQVLEEDQSTITAGFDNLLWINSDEKDVPFSPSFGYSRGFPRQVEAGIRYYLPCLLEANIRRQLNPETFHYFDASLNGHIGSVITFTSWKYLFIPYFKIGATVSKEFGKVQPFFSCYFNTNYTLEYEYEETLTCPSISFGIAIEHKKALFIPEFNYFKDSEMEKPIIMFGVGIRSIVKKRIEKSE